MIVNNNTSKRDFSTKVSKHVLHHINAHSIHGRPPPCCFCLTFIHSDLRAGTNILCSPKDHNRVYESLTLVRIMSHMNPLHIRTTYLPDIILIYTVSSHQQAGPPNGLCLTRLPTNTCHAFIMSPNVRFPFNVGTEDTRPFVCVSDKNVFSWAECSLAILFYSTCVIKNAVLSFVKINPAQNSAL